MDDERRQLLEELLRIRNAALRREQVLYDLTKQSPADAARHRRARRVTAVWLRAVALDPAAATDWAATRARIANLDPRFAGKRPNRE